jgi:hypothetical protein
MSQKVYRAVATGGITLAILLGLLVNISAPGESAIWFGVATGFLAAGAVVTFVLHRHSAAAVVSLAASASSVGSGHAGLATMGALAGLAILFALSDMQRLHMTDLRR